VSNNTASILDEVFIERQLQNFRWGSAKEFEGGLTKEELKRYMKIPTGPKNDEGRRPPKRQYLIEQAALTIALIDSLDSVLGKDY
jgi:hypothetical protein